MTTTLMTHEVGNGTLCTRAPWDGEYLLWEIRSPGNEHQIQSCVLKSGEPIGFDCTEGIVAIAGRQRWVLKPGKYAWERSVPEGEQAAVASFKIVMFPVMLGAGMGGGP